jgi:hypothetical protein
MSRKRGECVIYSGTVPLFFTSVALRSRFDGALYLHIHTHTIYLNTIRP